jgi:hypothetical protein
VPFGVRLPPLPFYRSGVPGGSNFRTQYKSMQNLRTLQGYIFRMSQPNFAILLILVCSFPEYTFFDKIKK